MIALIIGFVMVTLLSLAFLVKRTSDSLTSLKNQHVVITGGSSGIGKSLGFEVAKRGANITLIARDPEKLRKAKQEVLHCCGSPTQRVDVLSLDVSRDYVTVQKAFEELEQEMGPVYMLINCAGSAACGKLEDTSEEDIRKMFTLNCLGSIFPTKAVVEGMKARGRGHIVFTSSMAGLAGVFGYSAYSASKFALRGFAESLLMEVKPYGVRVSTAFPPDTNTPGFAEEEKHKPMETRLIGETAGLYEPGTVAKQILEDVMGNNFFSAIGLDGYIMVRLCAGMSPMPSFINLLVEVFCLGLFRLISLGYLTYFNRIVARCLVSKNKSKKAE